MAWQRARANGRSKRRWTVCGECVVGTGVAWIWNDRIKAGITKCRCGATWPTPDDVGVNTKSESSPGRDTQLEELAKELAELKKLALDMGNQNLSAKLQSGAVAALLERKGAQLPKLPSLAERAKLAGEKISRLQKAQSHAATMLKTAQDEVEKHQNKLKETSIQLAEAREELVRCSTDICNFGGDDGKAQEAPEPTAEDMQDDDIKEKFEAMQKAKRDLEAATSQAAEAITKKRRTDPEAAGKDQDNDQNMADAPQFHDAKEDTVKGDATGSEATQNASQSSAAPALPTKRDSADQWAKRIIDRANAEAQAALAAKRAPAQQRG